MSTPSTPITDSPTLERGSVLQFCLGCVVLAGILGVLAAHSPARIRLLGLFSIGFGLLTGWLLARLATTLNVRLDAPKIALIGIVTLAGLITSVCRTVALQPPSTAKNMIADMVEARMREAAEKGEPGADAPTEPLPLPTSPGFAGRLLTYLNRRVEMLGNWSSPCPELFWAGELLLGTAGSIGMALFSRRQEPRS